MRVQKGTVNAENNQFIGVSRGGKTTKIHAVVDGLGNPVRFMLTGGQVHDSKATDVLSRKLNLKNAALVLKPSASFKFDN